MGVNPYPVGSVLTLSSVRIELNCKEMQTSKRAVWGGLTNSSEKKRSKRQRRKGNIYPSECRVRRMTMRDKKAFLSDQCKETEEKTEWERLAISSRKLDIKGIFHAKMGTIKDRNGMDLTESDDTKKRW